MPWPLQEAINHGLSILGWYENFIEKEIPPETIWDDSEGTEEWFKMVRAKKDAAMGGVPMADDNDEGSGTDNSMIGNDLAGFFRE